MSDKIPTGRDIPTYNNNILLRRQRLSQFDTSPESMRRLERRYYTLLLSADAESSQRLLVSRDDVLCTAGVLQPGMLGTYAWVVQASGYRVCLDDLALLGLQNVCPLPVQDAWLTLRQRCAMMVAVQSW